MGTKPRTVSAAVTDANRKRLIKLIHVARREFERAGTMDEPTYRTMLRTAGGKDSTADMDVQALERVLAHAKRAGFKVRAKASDRRQDTRPEARKVRALWLFLHALGVVKDPTEAALADYVKRIGKVDDLHWANGQAMLALVETLKKWAMRFLPAAVKALRAEAAALAARGALSAEQMGLCQWAHDQVGHGTPTFDRHLAAWETYSAIVGRPAATFIKAELGAKA